MKKLRLLFFTLTTLIKLTTPTTLFTLSTLSLHAMHHTPPSKAWYATYHDPVFGQPYKVRYTPTPQEILGAEIEQAQEQDRPISYFNELLMRAVSYGTPAQTQLLLDLNADPNTGDHESAQPALHRAIRCGKAPAVQLLIQAKADIHTSDENGNTALHLAVATAGTPQRLAPIVHDLLNSGADPDIQNKKGETALAIALGKKQALFAMLQGYTQKNNSEPDMYWQSLICNSKNALANLVFIITLLRNAHVRKAHAES